MPHPLTDHGEFITRHGMLRWALRECVRANPLYVISAAFLAYGCLLLNMDIGPAVGDTRAIVLSLVLLHVYELAILAAATVVLSRRNAQGGRDLHGLTLVAALFLSGSFLALDELIALRPGLGLILIPAALLLAWFKLGWYARLPGLLLPLRYRAVSMVVLLGHSVSPLLGHPDLTRRLGSATMQELGWLCGWLSLLPVLHLVWLERAAIAAWRVQCDAREPNAAEPDLLQTRWGATFAVAVCIAVSAAHLCGSDWVFDRPADWRLCLPAVTMLTAVLMLRHWYLGYAASALALLVMAGPALGVQFACWSHVGAWQGGTLRASPVSPLLQFLVAAAVFYIALARATGRKEFYAGLLSPLGAVSGALLWSGRAAIPHFKALLSAAAGFALLGGAMLLSLFRERLLRWIDPRPAASARSETDAAANLRLP